MSAKEATISDARIRQEVLCADRSFLVQAPAGSGKTGLLIQRYLMLLGQVDEPEEILAITFTRKAAAEMRSRVLEALSNARAGNPPAEKYRKDAYALALKAINRERERDWQLDTQPNRLRISTIDSINARLAKRAPLSAGRTSSNALTEDAVRLYRAAARDTIYHAEERDRYGAAVSELLSHCDNRVDRLETLLTGMLARRDQWMPMLASGRGAANDDLRKALEQALATLVEDVLASADRLLTIQPEELTELLNYAGASISIEKPDATLALWQEVAEFPQPVSGGLILWRAMADVFLTKKGQWRRTLNKNQGFPPDGARMKVKALEMIERLATITNLESALSEVQQLPDPVYSERQWAALQALLIALPLAAANLKQVFAVQGKTDFCEIAQEALASLGGEEGTTESSLALDQQISHILLDEFQDTSRSQYELLKKITAGWQQDGSRTLFIVGDPMQSIYRFREAQVGLFLKAKEEGIGEIKLEFRSLEMNFRSKPAIVNWFNETFRQIMPRNEDEDPVTGAISFAPSVAYEKESADSCVEWHVTGYGDREAEAAKVCEIVRDTRSRDRDRRESIAILVRSRRHGKEIVRRLADEEIDYEKIGFAANDLDALAEHQVIQDLLALTRALAHPGDRLAWLAVLRAPWCGLTLADLSSLATAGANGMIWELVQAKGAIDGVSDDGQGRLRRIREPLRKGLVRKGSVALRDWIESVWLEIGGPATVADPSDLRLADDFFEFLESVDTAGDCPDNAELFQQLREWRTEPTAGNKNLQVLTMHQAKGLEFDTVILPGLAYPTRKDEKRLLVWHELPGTDESRAVVLAPLHAAGEKPDEIFEFLWRFDQQQAILEQDRLLYVASTRARTRLHLIAPLSRDDDGIAAPLQGSLLGRLWPAVRDEIQIPGDLTLPVRVREGAKQPDWFEINPERLQSDWATPSPPSAWVPAAARPGAFDHPEIEFEWVSDWAVHAGSVVHEWLQRLAKEALDSVNADRFTALKPAFEQRLRQLGVVNNDMGLAVDRVITALENTLSDAKGRWILFGQHTDAHSEFSMTVPKNEGFERLILDRTFVCEEGERWIVDFKTSTHEGGKLDQFLLSETRRYQPQLKSYRDAMAHSENRPIRTALYFPLLKEFHEVDVDREYGQP